MNTDLSVGVLADNIAGWHDARNLIHGSTDQAQFVKLMEEAGELAGNIARGKDVRDDIGDMIVVLTNIARRNGYTLAQCMQVAWDDIKDRRGRMVDGVFIKEEDLHLDIPDGTTHIAEHGYSFYRKQPDSKFWKKHINGGWIVISGEPCEKVLAIEEGEPDDAA